MWGGGAQGSRAQGGKGTEAVQEAGRRISKMAPSDRNGKKLNNIEKHEFQQLQLNDTTAKTGYCELNVFSQMQAFWVNTPKGLQDSHHAQEMYKRNDVGGRGGDRGSSKQGGKGTEAVQEAGRRISKMAPSDRNGKIKQHCYNIITATGQPPSVCVVCLLMDLET